MNNSDLIILTINSVLADSNREVNVLQKNNQKDSNSLDIEEIILYHLKNGLNPLGLLSNGSMVLDRHNNPLFCSLLEIANDIKDLYEPLWETVNESELKKLTKQQSDELMAEIVKSFKDSDIEKMFQKGWRLEQGTTVNNSMEIDMAGYNALNFFKLLAQYQPDFQFSRKYQEYDGNLTIKEYLIEVYGVDNKHQELLNFLEKQELKEKLQENLPINSLANPKMKI